MADTARHTRAAFERVRTIRSRMREFADPSILHGGVFRWPLMRRPDVESMLDGVQRDPVEPRHWRWLYSELHRGAIAGAPVPSPAEIEARAARHRACGLMPVAIANIRYGTPGQAFADELSRFVRAGGALPAPAPGSLEDKAAFFAAPLCKQEYHILRLLPERHDGLQVRYVVPSDLVIDNTDLAPRELEIDFDDGTGYRNVKLNEPVDVTYPSAGQRCIRVRLAGAGRDATGCRLTIAEQSAPIPDETWSLYSPITFQGVNATGYAYVFYGSGNTTLTNPLLMAEGFPGGYSINTLWNIFNEQNLAQDLLAQGYDLVLIGFDDGMTYVEANAGVVMAAVQYAINMTSSDTELVVGGASMGGLVARYALAYMETNNIPHQTSYYVSYDTPHLGASVPVGVQGFIQSVWLYTQDGSVEAPAALLNSNAAQEMLIYWVNGTTYTDITTGVSPLRANLSNNLSANGNFPKQPTLLGVSNGATDGTLNGTPASDYVLSAEGGMIARLGLAVMTSPGLTAIVYDDEGNKTTFPNAVCQLQLEIPGGGDTFVTVCGEGQQTPEYESAPGGTDTFFSTLGNELDRAGYPSTINYDSACFVPTISALSLSTLDVYSNDDLTGSVGDATSDLTAWIGSNNDKHVTITAQTAAWLLQQLPSKGSLRGTAASPTTRRVERLG
ncbi:esterase/lipase family protein [Rhizobium aegyptiacum]|uniref:esterase/lipase family protein n=1 Tax=Rhizobium aegyptiacum TaxID=1764550 RepID=UPI0007E5AEA2|nr:hypothetical protein [Rhizobium aegyptiacum]